MKFLLLVLLVCSGIAVASGSDKSLQTDIQNILDEEGLSGAAWALVLPNDEIQTGATGFANAMTGERFSPGHRFHVGSIAKTLLATGVLRLASENLVDLDERVDFYLPETGFDNPWNDTDPVTVRHLMDHTAGLDDARLWQMFSTDVTPDTPLIRAYTRNNDTLSIRSRPGSRLSYSNVGYGLLGMLIESVTGMRYEKYLDANLLTPIEMHNSTFRYTTQAGSHADTSLAWGHTDNVTPHPAVPVALRPAAQFTTTAHDLALFASFLMSDGDVNGKPFISEELMRARGHASTTEAAAAGLKAGYALGLSRWDRFGAVGYCHSGNIVGFKALLCVYPEVGKAFAVSINTDSETADYNRVFETLAAELDLPPPPPPVTAQPAPDIDEWAGWYRLEPNRFQQFAYLDALAGIVRLEPTDTVLTLKTIGGDTRVLNAAGDYLFTATDRSTPSHVLMRDTTGRHLVSDGYRTYARTPLAVLLALWLSALAACVAFLWFVLSGAFVLIRHRRGALRRAEMIPFAAVLLLLVPIPLFFTQSFVQLGDVTPASLSLAISTALLPALMLVALWKFLAEKRRTLSLAHAFFAICVLQWCAVLAAFDVLPLRLWS